MRRPSTAPATRRSSNAVMSNKDADNALPGTSEATPASSRLLKPHALESLNFSFTPRVQIKLNARLRKSDQAKNKTLKESTALKEQQQATLKSHLKATELIAKSTKVRSTLSCKHSHEMHMRNREDFKKTKTYTAPLDWSYEAPWSSWVAFAEKVENSYENPDFHLAHLSTIYGKTSHWGKIEEAEAERLANLNKSSEVYVGPISTPLEQAKAVYDATRIDLMVATNVQNALDHEMNESTVEDLLMKAKATIVLQRAVRIFRRRSWARKFALIDPALKELVEEEIDVEKHIKEQARQKVYQGMGGNLGNPSSKSSPSRKRSDTGMSDVTFASSTHCTSSPPKTSPIHPRQASQSSFRDVKLPGGASVMGSVGNSQAAESLKKLNCAAASAMASLDALELQENEKTRRMSNVHMLKVSIASPTQIHTANGRPSSPSTPLTPLEGVFELAMSPSEKIVRRASILIPPPSKAAAPVSASVLLIDKKEAAQQRKKRPSTAGQVRLGGGGSHSCSFEGSVKKQRPSTAKFGKRDRLISEVQLNRERSGQRRRGPRTLSKKSEALTDYQSSGAIQLLKKRDTGIKKMMKKGKLNVSRTAKNLLARVAFEEGQGSLESATTSFEASPYGGGRQLQ